MPGSKVRDGLNKIKGKVGSAPKAAAHLYPMPAAEAYILLEFQKTAPAEIELRACDAQWITPRFQE